MAKIDKIVLPAGTKVPDHVAIIMDGNRRWARARGLDTLEGHRAGFDRAIQLGRAARQMGIHTVSLWGFSTENWDREKRELDYLMMLYRQMLKKYLKEAMEDGVRLIHLGRKDRLPKELIKELGEAEEKTRHFEKHIVNICLDYGGRDEILRAVNRIVREIGEVGEIGEKEFEKYLDTHDQPYPYVDLLIRTSGEQRTSGFLLWQMPYAEMYWEIDHLPDFSPEKFRDAVLDYARRRRRFGGNDAMEHFKFDPRVVARLEMDFRRELTVQNVARYVKEQYGLSKEIAKEAGGHLARALLNRQQEEWAAAKDNLRQLYEMVRKNVGLALEPEVLANIEVNFWKTNEEAGMRELLAEKFRISGLQAAKSAHLAVLANKELDLNKARGYLEKFYQALKERVA